MWDLEGVGSTLTTDNGTQFTSTRFLESLVRLGITHGLSSSGRKQLHRALYSQLERRRIRTG